MSQLLRMARLAVLASLAGTAALSVVLTEPGQARLVISALGIALTEIGAWALWRNRQTAFSLAAGASLVLNTLAMVLLGGQGYEAAWAVFGVGMATLMTGNHSCRSAEVLSARRGVGGKEDLFRRAALRGYMRIVLFIGLVMVLSFLILLLSLNADVGAMPSWAMAALALVAIASLAILARARHQDA